MELSASPIQLWEIDPHVGDAQSANGALGDPYQTAARVCAVVKHHGGAVQ